MISLYAYFGLLRPHTIDSPGHSLYQLGLIDSIRESYGEDKFDFYSYYPKWIIENSEIHDFPATELGDIFRKYRNEMIEGGPLEFSEVIDRIQKKAYRRLYLKARFRNLSTLSKKWKDAREFETMVTAAIAAGYKKEEIIILDTDLSLPDSFVYRFKDDLTILIPSIDFPGISNRFLDECIDERIGKFDQKKLDTVYYGNIDTSSYKSGNSKSAYLQDILQHLNSEYAKMGGISMFTLICKENEKFELMSNSHLISRSDRPKIWQALVEGTIMLNVSKDKYDERQFIPARVYEAMIFGMIPVSYKFNFLCEAFSFRNSEDLDEILTYLRDCTPDDLAKAYLHFVKSYKKHANNIPTKTI